MCCRETDMQLGRPYTKTKGSGRKGGRKTRNSNSMWGSQLLKTLVYALIEYVKNQKSGSACFRSKYQLFSLPQETSCWDITAQTPALFWPQKWAWQELLKVCENLNLDFQLVIVYIIFYCMETKLLLAQDHNEPSNFSDFRNTWEFAKTVKRDNRVEAEMWVFYRGKGAVEICSRNVLRKWLILWK